MDEECEAGRGGEVEMMEGVVGMLGWAGRPRRRSAAEPAHAGGWKDTRALELSYQHADPETVLRVVEGGGRA